MKTPTYIKFKGAVYRKAYLPTYLNAPGKALKWGPEEWPTEEYLEGMSEKPPLSRQEYDFLLQKRQELTQQLSSTTSPAEQRAIARDLHIVEEKIMATRVWLSERRPDYHRLKHWAKSK
jgi:hypothetical protein